MKCILFVHNSSTRFVEIDRELLKEHYVVTELYETNIRDVRPLQVRRAVEAHDLIFCWFASWHSLAPVLFACRLGKPSVVVVGGYDTANHPEAGYGLQRGGARRLISRRIIHNASHLITNSQASKRGAISSAGVDPEKITVIYHGVDPLFIGKPDGREPLVLTVGNVWRENLLRKGLLPFVQAAACLPHIKFIHVGRWCDGSIEELHRVATPNVDFLGYLSDADLAVLYARAAVYVQPSLHEGFGLSVAEAMSVGCVPVVTEVGGLPEVVGDAGVYISSQSPKAIAEGIRAAFDLDGEIRVRARERVRSLFSIEQRRDRLFALIDGMIDGKKSASPVMLEEVSG